MASAANRPSKNRRTRQSASTPFSMGPDLQDDDLFLSVSGFKAVGEETTLRLAPLTVISGTNSAGKSSFMQPFLIMKQTLESSFDPGALLLFGPNAKFTDASQTLSRTKSKNSRRSSFSISMRCGEYSRAVEYEDSLSGYIIAQDVSTSEKSTLRVPRESENLSLENYRSHLSQYGRRMLEQIEDGDLFADESGIRPDPTLSISRQRCFLDMNLSIMHGSGSMLSLGSDFFETHTDAWTRMLRGIIHVPGLRGNPEREYPRSAVGRTYPGTIETYVASIILDLADKDIPRLELLCSELTDLGLTWKVSARKVNDAAVELLVGRMPHAQQGGARDMVSVADVGFGVSQTLPVVVALIVASPGQIVYLEQPEIHLHPRAQVQLAKVLVRASKRGVKVVTETHSALLIRAIQTEIARGNISESDVSLNWFSRDENTGFTTVSVADLDNKGRFGEWPLDFDEISQDADMDYLEAIASK